MYKYISQHLLLLYISTISYLRYLFPSKCFDNIYFNGMSLKRLNGNSMESKFFLEHIEQGLFDGLYKGYIKSIILYLYADDCILEIYTLDVANINGMDIRADRSREDIKNDFTNLLKSLIVFLQRDKREWCLKSGKNKCIKNTNFASIKVIHTSNSPIAYIPPTFDPPTKLNHFTNKTMSDNGVFEKVYESDEFNTGLSVIKLNCDRRVLK